MRVCVCVSPFSHVWLFATPWTVDCQVSLLMGISKQEHWSMLPCSPPEDLPNPGIEPVSLTSPVLSSVQFSSVAQSCPTLCDPMNCSTPGLPVHHQLPEFTKSHTHLILCCHLLLLPPIPPCIRVFSNKSALCMRWPKYWSFSLSISPSNEHPGLISFRMDWLDLLAVQGTLKSLLQHHSSKASILQCSAFFPVQLSHPYMTTGKTIALIGRTFVGKVMSLLFNMLPRLLITFLPRSKRLLISWL